MMETMLNHFSDFKASYLIVVFSFKLKRKYDQNRCVHHLQKINQMQLESNNFKTDFSSPNTHFQNPNHSSFIHSLVIYAIWLKSPSLFVFVFKFPLLHSLLKVPLRKSVRSSNLEELHYFKKTKVFLKGFFEKKLSRYVLDTLD